TPERAGPGRRLGLRLVGRPLPPERARDPGLAGWCTLLGRGACALARARQDDHHGLPGRPARHPRPRGAARPHRDDHAHDRRLRAGRGYARPLTVDLARHALPLAEPRLRPARRRNRRRGPAAPPPAAPPAPPRPSSPPPRRPVATLAARRRCVRRAAALPLGARRPARGDLTAPEPVPP